MLLLANKPGCEGAPGTRTTTFQEIMRTVIQHQNLFMTGIAVAILSGWLILT